MKRKKPDQRFYKRRHFVWYWRYSAIYYKIQKINSNSHIIHNNVGWRWWKKQNKKWMITTIFVIWYVNGDIEAIHIISCFGPGHWRKLSYFQLAQVFSGRIVKLNHLRFIKHYQTRIEGRASALSALNGTKCSSGLLSKGGYKQKFKVLALRLALEKNFSLVVIKVTWWNVTKNYMHVSAQILFFQTNLQSSLTFLSINSLSHINSPISNLPHLLFTRFGLASASLRYTEPDTGLLLRDIRSQI